MANQSEMDYEKRFQEDLEKATALSLETLALEQFKRTRLQYSHSDASVSSRLFQTHNEQSTSHVRARPGSFNAGSLSSSISMTDRQSPIAPPPVVPPRRHSEVRLPERSDESDLISFTSPTSTKKDDNINFDNLVEEIQRLNAQVQHHNVNNYGFNQATGAAAAAIAAGSYATSSPQNLQLVPYLPQAGTHNSNTTPLTSEQLTKLYNMKPQMPFHATPSAFHHPQQIHMRPMMHHTAAGLTPMPNFPSTQTSAIPNYGFHTHLFTPPTVGFNIHPTASGSTPPPRLVVSSSQDSPSTPPVAQLNQQQINTQVLKQQQQMQMPRSLSASGVSSLIAATATASSSSQNNSTPPSEVIRRPKKSLGNDDLIDWGHEESSRVSVLETFDPLLSKESDYKEPSGYKGDNSSDCATSYYSEYDPFDYLYSCGTQYSDPVYEAVNRTDKTPMSPSSTAPPIGWNIPSSVDSEQPSLSPPPLPPRNYKNGSNKTPPHQVLDRRKQSGKLYENVTDRKTYDSELMAFYQMVKELRTQYKFDDISSNVGHIIAAEFDNHFVEGTSIKLIVHPSLDALRIDLEDPQQGQIPGFGAPVIFTCDINTTVEHVIMHVYCALEGQIRGAVTDYMVKPIGILEWLSTTSKLSQLECVHDSLKLERDVQLGLCQRVEENVRAIARTRQDDLRHNDIKPEDILPNENTLTITYDSLMILIETLENEIEKFVLSVSDASPRSVISCSGVGQAVKAICAHLGSIDTLKIAECVEDLRQICSSGQNVYISGCDPSIVSEYGDYAQIALRPKSTLDQARLKCDEIREAVQDLIETYSNAFRVDFCVKTVEYSTAPIPLSCVLQPIMIHINCLHRPPPHWKYDSYSLASQVWHGTRYIDEPAVYEFSNETSGIFSRLKFDTWITFKNSQVCTLPRESRLLFVLYGCQTVPAEGDQTNDANQERRQIKTEIGWCAIQLFDFQNTMIMGSYLLALWPPTTDKFLGPAPPKGTHPQSDFCPVLSLEIPSYGGRIIFPEPLQNPPPMPKYDFYSLDQNLQRELLDTAELGYQGPLLDKREVLWEKRHYLQQFPHALPKVLHAAHHWDCSNLVDLHALLRSWQPLKPLQSLELLLPRYPDLEVRSRAVSWISRMPNDQLVDYLPQLLQALKHDTYEASPLAKFLLCRSLESPRIAHHLYWLLVHSLPGDSPQNSIDASSSETNETFIMQARYHRRNQMMLRALLAISGEKLSRRFLAQNMICKSLAETAESVKQTKESMRQKTLLQGMEIVSQILVEEPTSLPLGPGLEVTGVNARNCSYFNSNTLPLKIAFIGPDGGISPAIFKSGDDLQQDMLTIQLIRVMDKLWLAQGLDLKMVTFNCVPTGNKKGMIELVTEAETLRKIQVECGLTGSFKDKPIAEWLAKQNPSQLEYQRAVDNFTVSCAGYSVATYILGICDRHNDNIMLKTSGHLFHIDFGKFLGDAQMFGNFKRDRTPFVLTSDMAYVINGGDKPSTKFHNFVDLCCKAFNIVRDNRDLLLHMLALMATAGIPGVTADAVTYVRKALLPNQSNPEAAASFAKMIQFSLKSWFTQFNFFLHNLAQLKFSSDDGCGELLSFVPRTYTMQMDGRLKSVMVHGYQKRYDLEKYYTYILRVTRQGQPDPAYLFRSYKEFLEFHQKLCLHFPLAKLHSLPSGIHVGRSNIKTVAERRLPEIRQFLVSLFNSADEIAHSDLVYTFFHPLLRDQQEADIHVTKVKDVRPPNQTEHACGEIKLSLQYRRGQLTVMIHHARGLPTLAGGQEPNPYIKCYLKPDPIKATKRKTKVMRKTCVPSFMETLEYRMPIDIIQNRTLHVTVWSHDTLQENELLGGFELNLSEINLRDELVQWFRLQSRLSTN